MSGWLRGGQILFRLLPEGAMSDGREEREEQEKRREWEDRKDREDGWNDKDDLEWDDEPENS